MNARAAYDAGFEAGRTGQTAVRNPYARDNPVGRAKHAAWKAGWDHARKVREERKR